MKVRPAEKEKVKGTTLYSIRHQAVANAKAADVDDIEIAAVFGHISVRTSKERYGRKTRLGRQISSSCIRKEYVASN